MADAPNRAVDLIKRTAPYLFAIGILAWVLHRTDLHVLGSALSRAPLGVFVLVSALLLFANCGADTFAMGSVFRWFGCPVPYNELFVVRASTYLLAIINYHVGQAAIVGYLYRARRVPLMRASGWILFIIGINVGTLFLLASGGAIATMRELMRGGGFAALLDFHGAGLERHLLALVPFACGLGLAVYVPLLLWKPPILAQRRILAPLFEMGVIGHIKGVLVRLPHVMVLMIWHTASLHMFGIPIPGYAALLYLPAYFAVAALPISVNGLGMAQLVAIDFFSIFVHVPAGTANPEAYRQATVIAYSLATSGVSILLQVALGLMFLRRATALGVRTDEPEPAAATPAASTDAATN